MAKAAPFSRFGLHIAARLARTGWRAQNRRRTWTTRAVCTYMGRRCLRRPRPISPRLGPVAALLSSLPESPLVVLIFVAVRLLRIPPPQENFSQKWPRADASTVVALVTRLLTAPRRVPPPAITAVKRATSRATARPRPRQRPVTSAGRRAISPGNAQRTPTRQRLVAAASLRSTTAVAVAPARSATAAAKLATSRVRAPRLPAVLADSAAARSAAASAEARRRLATPAVV